MARTFQAAGRNNPEANPKQWEAIFGNNNNNDDIVSIPAAATTLSEVNTEMKEFALQIAIKIADFDMNTEEKNISGYY